MEYISLLFTAVTAGAVFGLVYILVQIKRDVEFTNHAIRDYIKRKPR